MTRPFRSLAGGTVLLFLSTLSASASEAPARLVTGTPIRRTISATTPDVFLLAAEAGQYVHVAVTQEGVDVALTLDAPDGTRLRQSDLADLAEGVEPLSLVVPQSGDYRLTVRSRYPEGGAYTLAADAPRAPEEADRGRVAAEDLLRDGEQYRQAGTAEALQQSLPALERAAARWRDLDDPRFEALALFRQGQVQTRLGQNHAARASFGRALELSRALGDLAYEAASLHGLGVLHYYLGQMPQCFDALAQALAIRQARGDRRAEAATLSTLAAAHGAQGDARKVIDLSGQALALRRELGDEKGQALTLFNIGLAHYQTGSPQKALDELTDALNLAERSADPFDEAPILGILGEVYSGLGDGREALRLGERALGIWRAVGDRAGEAGALHAIANEHLEMGEAAQALSEYEHVRDLHRQSENGREHVVMIWMAAAYRRLGERARAIALLQEALPPLEKSSVWHYPEALRALGQLSREQGDLEAAMRYQSQALALFRALSAPTEEAGCLHELALVDAQRGDLQSARARLEESLALGQQTRRGVGNPELRASFGASAARMREAYLEVLVRLHEREPQGGWLARAYAAAETGRAQTLLEMLGTSRSEAAAFDPDLRERARVRQAALASVLDRQVRLLTGPHTQAEAAEMETEVQAARSAHRAAQARLTAAVTAFTDTQRVGVLPLSDVQQRVLDADSLLLEYALGETRSFLFAISPSFARVHVLPGRATLDEIVKPLAESFAAPPPREGEAPGPARAALDPALAASRVLLGPVADELAGRRLVIVPDGALHLVPFGALPLTEGGDPLLSRHEVVSLPSASLLPTLRDQAAQRAGATRGAAVFADPLFELSDDRIRGGARRVAPRRPHDELSRAIDEAGLGERIPRLAFTRREARAIAALAPGSRLWLDAAASRANAVAPELASYRYVHFATHGFLNSAHPELSGLVLSLFDRKGRAQDGFLAADDVYEMKLSAELVVLSGCRTALGRQLAGEGVMGLTRAFMYAGTSRVVSSLWKVDDSATAELMTRFYEGMLRESLRPAAALRRAQLAVAAQKRWAHPYYWAGFQLQGDWQ